MLVAMSTKPFHNTPQTILDTWRLFICFLAAVSMAGTVMNLTVPKMRKNPAWTAAALLNLSAMTLAMALTVVKLGYPATIETALRSLVVWFGFLFTYRSY